MSKIAHYNLLGSMPEVLVMILAGGEGRRLYPLTAERAKPAVPFGGRYRIIDIVLSNFVNSGFTKIKVLTQYKSHSLETHLARAWRLSAILDNYIEPIPAQQRTGKRWFEGSADAVYQCQHVIIDEHPEYVCVFGGDHVYVMDVRQMLAEHLAMNAEVTVAAIPVPIEEAHQFGIMKVDKEGWIIEFQEKPKNPSPMPNDPTKCLASMGNYIFNTDVLLEELNRDAKDPDSKHDFGGNIIPSMIGRRRVFAYDFSKNVVPGSSEHERGYWRDIGTIDSYWEAHMDLISLTPSFNLYNRRWPIRTGFTHLPPAKFVHDDKEGGRIGIATNSMVSEGCIISGGRISRSVLSPMVRVNSFAQVDECILLNNVNVGRYARLRRCIVDKEVDIPPGIEIGYDLEKDKARGFTISPKGIVVIPKRMKINV